MLKPHQQMWLNYDNPLLNSCYIIRRLVMRLLTHHHIDEYPVNAIVAAHPFAALATSAQLLLPSNPVSRVVHSHAQIDRSVIVGERVGVGAHAFIEQGVQIGDNACMLWKKIK